LVEWRVLSEGFDAALTPFFSYYPAYVSFSDSLGEGEKDSLVLFEGKHFWQAFDPDCFARIGALALQRFARDEAFCSRVDANHAEGVRRMTVVAGKALAAAKQGCSGEEAAALVKEFDSAFYYAAMWGTVISAVEYGVESLLARELAAYFSRVAPQRNANELIEALSFHSLSSHSDCSL
jgi:hypothetical protein